MQDIESFGKLLRRLRKEKGWIVDDVVHRIYNNKKSNKKKVSRVYFTKIEVHDEIPSFEMVCLLADVFGYNEKKMAEIAKRDRLEKKESYLDNKYAEASVEYNK